MHVLICKDCFVTFCVELLMNYDELAFLWMNLRWCSFGILRWGNLRKERRQRRIYCLHLNTYLQSISKELISSGGAASMRLKTIEGKWTSLRRAVHNNHPFNTPAEGSEVVSAELRRILHWEPNSQLLTMLRSSCSLWNRDCCRLASSYETVFSKESEEEQNGGESAKCVHCPHVDERACSSDGRMMKFLKSGNG